MAGTDSGAEAGGLRARLMAAGAADVHLSRRNAAGFDGLVAYVVGGERDTLQAALAGAGDAVVRVSALPLDDMGAIDEAALAALPVWSPGAVDAAQRQWGSALVARPAVQPASHLHLCDLLPGRPLLGDPAPAPAARRGTVPLHERIPAVHHSPALPDAGVGYALEQALVRAAARPAAGIVHVAADLSQSRTSYAQLLDEACRALGGLLALGLKAGDTVIVDAGDSRHLLPVFWGCVLGGLVPAPLALGPAAAGGAGLERLLNCWEVAGRAPVVGSAAALAGLRPHAAALQGMQLLEAQALQAGAPAQPSASAGPAQPALMLLTSGSTGTPKGVVLSRGNLAAMISGVQQQLRFVPGETALNWMPLDHVGGVVFLCVMPTVLGLDQVQVDTATILEAPARWLDLVAEHRVAAVWAPNFAFDLLLRAARSQAPGHWDLSCLRMLINAGEPVSEPILVDFERRFAQDGLRQGAVWMSFGMTETVSAFSLRCWTASGEAVTSLGHPIAGGAQRIVDDAGRTLMEGEIGRVELSGPSVFSGYHGRPDLTAEALRDGWFQTGDMGFLRSGELHIVGRVKEMIIVNGANFYSAEIEEAAARVPGLDRQGLAAIGVRPAGAATDQLVLFFHAPGAGEPQLRRSLMRALRMRLGQDLGLAVDHFIAVPPERLPRTGAGKVQRVELRRLVEAGAFDREIKDAACLIGGAGTVPAWFARPVWRPRQHDASPAMAPAQAHALTVALCGAGAQALAQLQALQPRHRWMALDDTGSPADAVAALREWAPDVLVLAGEQALAPGLLQAARWLAAPGGHVPGRLLVCAGTGQDEGQRAMARAVLRSLEAEMPALRCRHVAWGDAGVAADADASVVADAAVLDAAGLCAELGCSQREPEVLWHAGVRRVRRLLPLVPEAAGHQGFQEQGLYLLAGGLGGVGFLLARHLLGRYRARLLIVGRAPAVARRQPLELLSRSGALLYVQADVTDPAALQAAVVQAQQHFGQTLAGVVQLAAESRLALCAEEEEQCFARAQRAKVEGTRHLHALIAHDPRALFLVAGSVMGLLGGRRVAAYAAGDAWQMAFVERQAHSASGARCRYLGFSAWRDTGLSRQVSNPALFAASGYLSIDEAQGLQAFELAVRGEQPVMTVGLDFGHPRHAALREGAICGADELVWVREGAAVDARRAGEVDQVDQVEQVNEVAGSGDPSAPHRWLHDACGRPVSVPVLNVASLPTDARGALDRAALLRLAAGMASSAAPRNAFERYMVRLWCKALGLADCGVDDDFFSLGGNSLGAAQIAARTRELFRVDISMAELLRHPCMADFCQRVIALESRPGITLAIAGRLFEIESMTPDQKAAAHGAAATKALP